VHIRRIEQPFIEPALFLKRKFIIVILSGFILFGTGMGVLFMMPLMLNQVHQLTPDAIGWILFPSSMSVIIFGAVGGRLADRRGNLFVLYFGLFLLIISLLTISQLINKTPWLISGALLPAYAGISFIKTAVSNSVTQTLDTQEIGVGMGLFSLTSFLSEAVGTALVGKTLDNRMLEFSLFPTITEPSYFVYSNILFVFVVLILLGGVVYKLAFRNNVHSAKI
jgi:DHA2 family metal-tetracycline-proton antiporter-like MFS transporter